MSGPSAARCSVQLRSRPSGPSAISCAVVPMGQVPKRIGAKRSTSTAHGGTGMVTTRVIPRSRAKGSACSRASVSSSRPHRSSAAWRRAYPAGLKRLSAMVPTPSPRQSARISPVRAAFFRVTTTHPTTGTPRSRSARTPSIVGAKHPGPTCSSCRAASGPFSVICTERTPSGARRAATRSSMSPPFEMIWTGVPRAARCSSSAKMSLCAKGSPPVRVT